MQRLKEDLHTWRSVLQDATTIATNVMAQLVITDDLQLLSALLSQLVVDQTLLTMTPHIAHSLQQNHRSAGRFNISSHSASMTRI
jgi:hypothetical protein